MTSSNRQAWPFVIFPLLAGALLSLAWWDWTYPGQIWAWWHNEHIYAYYVQHLCWLLLVAEIFCLSLWRLAIRLDTDQETSFLRASAPFTLSLLALPFLARYSFHPLNIQPGSSAWTYGLVTITALVVSVPTSRLFHATHHHFSRALLLVCTLAILYALIFGLLSAADHTSFRTHALDMGTMDQAAWNTIHGRILERTPLGRHPAQGTRYESRFLDAKLELVFIPLSALYWLWADPRILLIAQTLALAAGAIPLYLLVHERSRSVPVATLLSAAYLFYLPLHYVNMAEFHPLALMAPFFILAWRAMRGDRWRWYYLWLALALICRIEAAIVALILGSVILLWRKGKRRHGLITMLIAAGWLILDLAVVAPVARQAYPSASGLIEERFGALGNTPVEIMWNILTHPLFVIRQLVSREKLQTIFDLFAPLGFLPLFSPLALLPALPMLGLNLLAGSAWQSSIYEHYMAPVIPFVWIAAAEALIWLNNRRVEWATRLVTTLAVFVLLNTALTAILFSPFPPGKNFYLASYVQRTSYTQNLRTVIALIPSNASICAQSDIHPHLAHRRDAALFPNCLLDDETYADYVIVDLDAASNKSPLGFHAFYELVDQWLDKEEFGVIAQQGGVLLLGRGASRANMAAVQSALDRYGQEFYHADIRPQAPATMKAEELYRLPVVLRNTGSQCWDSRGQLPVRLSYRWWTDKGALVAIDPLRTDLAYRVEPGSTIRLKAWVLTPPKPGAYILEWDIVREGDAWFSDKGANKIKQEVIIE